MTVDDYNPDNDSIYQYVKSILINEANVNHNLSVIVEMRTDEELSDGALIYMRTIDKLTIDIIKPEYTFNIKYHGCSNINNNIKNIIIL